MDGLTGDLMLIASEMATNAVTHARSRFQLSMSVLDDSVRIEVSDSDVRRPPDPAPAWRTETLTGPGASQIDQLDYVLGSSVAQEDVSGRGLMIVAALAASWGVAAESATLGKTVWAACLR